MKVTTRKPFFIHIPKTGGTTVCEVLKSKGIEVENYPHGMGHFTFNDRGRGFGTLLNYRDWLSDHFFFTVVRNPFDLLVSWYFHPNPEKSGWCHEARGLSFEGFINKFLANDFYHKGFSTDPFGQLYNNSFEYVPEVTIRFEFLNEGLERMLIDCGLHDENEALSIPSENVSLYRPERDYRLFYTPEMRKSLEIKLESQLKLFGYTFDGPTDDRAIL